MALLPILAYPDPKLSTVASPVDKVDDSLAPLLADMFETMYAANGVGLAATQIDVHRRIVVIDVSEERNQPMVLINPEIQWLSEEFVKGDEGCLSVPGIYDGVERAARVRATAGRCGIAPPGLYPRRPPSARRRRPFFRADTLPTQALSRVP